MWDLLHSHGWKLTDIDSATGLKKYDTKDKPVDRWIRAPNARPNQYADPELNVEGGNDDNDDDASSQEEGGSSHASFGGNFQKSVLTALGSLSTQMISLSTQNKEIHTTQNEILSNQTSIKETLVDHGVRLGRIEENHSVIEKGYTTFFNWTTNEFRPFYQDYQGHKEDYQGLKERYITRFGGDDDDLNEPSGSHRGGDDDPMEP